MDAFYEQPPIIRTLTAAVFVTSCAAYASSSLLYQAYFDVNRTFFTIPPQIWRALTTFLVSGPKLGIIMDPYFLFTYGKQLETGSPRFKSRGDFFWYILFNMIIIEIIGAFLGLPFLNEGLILAFVHTFAQENPNAKAYVFIMQVDAKFLPFGMILINFFTRGPSSAYVSAAGLVASHTYDFLTRIWPTFGGGKNWIETPPLIKRWFGDDQGGTRVKSYGTAYNPASAGQSSTSGSSTSTSWSSRGVGRRLGS